MTAMKKVQKRMEMTNSLVCVGLDSDYEKLPDRFKDEEYPQFLFNKWIIDETHEYVCAYKPNIAFYEARGEQGSRELKMTMEYIQEKHPDIFTICDAKRADIGSTNDGYVAGIFDWLGFDAITLHPYLGREALAPFLKRRDKVSIVLCHTSNPGAGEVQDLEVNGRPLWLEIAHRVTHEWNVNKNCMLVVGATYPKELAIVRKVVGDMTLLIPGIGAQGGEVGETIRAGKNSEKRGMILNSSRAIIFSPDPKAQAKKLCDEIRMCSV